MREDPPWKQNQDAMRKFQAEAEAVGYARRQMEEAIGNLQDAFVRKVEQLNKVRYATLYGLKEDPDHNADGTPR